MIAEYNNSLITVSRQSLLGVFYKYETTCITYFKYTVLSLSPSLQGFTLNFRISSTDFTPNPNRSVTPSPSTPLYRFNLVILCVIIYIEKILGKDNQDLHSDSYFV